MMKRGIENFGNDAAKKSRFSNRTIYKESNIIKKIVYKKGLSPVVATVLLVSIAVSLAGIIFFWAYSFIGESVTKNGRAIDQVCQDVAFEAERSLESLLIKNIGDVPIWGVELREKNALGGDLTKLDDFSSPGIKSGETAEVSLEDLSEDSEDLIVSPILMGETETERKKYVCGNEYSQTI